MVTILVTESVNYCGATRGGVWRSLWLEGVWSQSVGGVFVRLTGNWLQ
jgi:hypothetical protein